MTLTWTIVGKDFQRLRWILLLWVVLIAGSMALANIQRSLDAENYYPFYVAVLVFNFGLLPLISFGLVMGLIHDDPVADTDAFWITRPISNGQLLAAKSIAMALLCLVPVFVTLPYWLSQNFDLGQIGSAARQTLIMQVALTLLALPIAVLSPNGSKFVAHVMLGGVILAILILLSRVGTAGPESEGLVRSRNFVLVGVGMAGTGATVLSQFLGRRTRRSVIILSMAVLLGFVTARAWPWEFNFLATKNSSNREAAALSLKFGSASLRPREMRDRAGRQDLQITFKLEGVIAGSFVVTNSATHNFQWPNGSAVELPALAMRDELAKAARAAALGKAIESSGRLQFLLPAELPDKTPGLSGASYRAVIEGNLVRLKVVAEVPLREGAALVRDGVAVKIQSMVWDGLTQTLVVAIGESEPVSPSKPAGGQLDFFFLINRSDGQSLAGSIAPTGNELEAAALRYSHSSLSFANGKDWAGPAPANFHAWLNDAVLVKVVGEDAGAFRRTVVVAALP